MSTTDKAINLVLIADDPRAAALLHDTMQKAGIRGVIRRIGAGSEAVEYAHKADYCRDKSPPDLIFFDFADPDENRVRVLSDIAFGEKRAQVPVVLLTSSNSLELLDNGSVGDASAVMFSPTSLPSFVNKMKNGKRSGFIRALRTLYQYGPILVRLPIAARHYGFGLAAVST